MQSPSSQADDTFSVAVHFLSNRLLIAKARVDPGSAGVVKDIPWTPNFLFEQLKVQTEMLEHTSAASMLCSQTNHLQDSMDVILSDVPRTLSEIMDKLEASRTKFGKVLTQKLSQLTTAITKMTGKVDVEQGANM